MAKYHVTPKGESKICFARTACPFGDLAEDHYSSRDAAIVAYERANQKEIFKTFGNTINDKFIKRTDLETGEIIFIPKAIRSANTAYVVSYAYQISFALATSNEKVSRKIVNSWKKFLNGEDVKLFEKDFSKFDFSKGTDRVKFAKVIQGYIADFQNDLPLGFTKSHMKLSSATESLRKKK